ncbi:MAG: hypothetical protein WB507_12850 [Solirubrobacterales bacterium]
MPPTRKTEEQVLASTPDCDSAAPSANSEPPIRKALAASALIRRRRRAVPGSADAVPAESPAAEIRASVPRLRAAREDQTALPPCGRRQLTRVVNGPPPSASSTSHSAGLSRVGWAMGC